MTKYLLGIDPGASGAMCLYPLGDDLPVIIEDMPTLEITRNGKKRTQIDLYPLARWMDEHSKSIRHAFIENPQGMPGMASNSTYRLGLNVGIAQMAVAANLIPMTLVAPATWKKAMGLGKNKDDSRLKASQMRPDCSHFWTRKSDDGRAEALLLCVYAIKMGGFGG